MPLPFDAAHDRCGDNHRPTSTVDSPSVALDEPRFLDRRPHRSYTSNPALAMRGEGEPVDDETFRNFSADARRRFEDERANEIARREAKSRSARLRNAQQEALRLGIDGRHELAAIDVQIDLLSRKNARARATA